MAIKRAIFLKQSGELLEKPGAASHWQAAHAVAANIADAYKRLNELSIGGLTVVPGAGNIARGEKLRAQNIEDKYADVLGRWGTIGNSIVLVGALESLRVPVELIITNKMNYQDPVVELKTYTPQAVLAAHRAGKVVIIAGGSGEENVTTDNAVAFYAADFGSVFDGEIVILKSTKFDGVYVSDPAQAAAAPPARYKRISASTIKRNYQQLKVVDARSLDRLLNDRLSMLVYSDAAHSLSEVLASIASASPDTIGTLIVPESIEPELAAS